MEENQVVKQVHKITKEKHPGRVAAGKRLTEWNQQNKAKLKLENLDQASSNASSLQAPSSSLQAPSSSLQAPSVSISLIIFGVLAVGGYYLWEKKPQQNVSESKPKTQEIFNPFQGI